MATPPSRRRRPPKVDTERAEAIRSCARHLKDLQRAHKQPPTDVEVNLRGVPRFVPPVIEQSYCTSPAALCAELDEFYGSLPEGAPAERSEQVRNVLFGDPPLARSLIAWDGGAPAGFQGWSRPSSSFPIAPRRRPYAPSLPRSL